MWAALGKAAAGAVKGKAKKLLLINYLIEKRLLMLEEQRLRK